MGILTVLLFMLWIGVTGSKVVDLQKRIIGGQNCGQNERHYHVKLTGQLLCGGSLISDRWILTAAHCLKPGMKVVLGVHPGQQKRVETPSQHIAHRTHDIMLIKIPTPTNMPTIPLADCSSPLQPGNVVQTAGYEGNNEATFLQCANFTIGSCALTIDDSGRVTSCLEVQAGQTDISPGDSGGGVVFNNRIYGINIGRSKNDAPVRLAYFLDICNGSYFNWINDIIHT